MKYFENILQIRKTFDLMFHYYLFIVATGINVLISIFDESAPWIFYRKMRMTRHVRMKMERKVFISRQNWHFLFVDNLFKVLCTLTWRVNNYFSHQVEGINRRHESTVEREP